MARHWPEDNPDEITDIIETLLVFFLAGIIERCLGAIRQRLPSFGEAGDICTVNMAVPVAHVQDRTVEEAFHYCLGLAWRVAYETQKPAPTVNAYRAAIRRWKREGVEHDFCFIYPEVSANVQSFLKSPARRPGTFLFVDVGAGTVDASAFVWPAVDAEKQLTYLAAKVIPLGSSQIEQRATDSIAARLTQRFRTHKEGKLGDNELHIDMPAELRAIVCQLRSGVADALRGTLDVARRKLLPAQWREIRILLGGGGCSDGLYTGAVQDSFDMWHLTPETLELPMPGADLEWPADIDVEDQPALFRRISVAYGLSFDRGELEGHRYPDEVGEMPRAEKSDDRRTAAPEQRRMLKRIIVLK